MSFHLFYLVVLLNQSVYPNSQRKSVYRPSRLKCRLSSVSRLINITFVLKTDIQIRRCAFLSNSNVYINHQKQQTASSVNLGQKYTSKGCVSQWRRKVPCTRSSLVEWISPEEKCLKLLLVLSDSFNSFIDFHNENVFSSL